MLDRVSGVPGRLIALAENAAEVARFGGLRASGESAPHVVVASGRHHRVRRYFPDAAATGPAIVLVAPLMMSAEVWDVSPEVSAVRQLHAAGIDPWVVDFGKPDREEGGLERTLSDHVVAVSSAVDMVRVPGTRPSAVAAVAALNRLGAGGDHAQAGRRDDA